MPSKRLTVYLSGPMSGLTGPEMTEWRRHAETTLATAGYTVRDPCRGMTFAESDQPLQPDYAKSEVSNDHACFIRDRFDVVAADILLVNLLGARKVSIGTVVEVAWAHLLDKFTVLVMEQDNPHRHAFMAECSGVIFEDIDDAVAYILKNFGS